MWAVITTFALGVTLVIGAKVLGRWHYDPALWALAGWSVPPDFSVFYQAADAVLSGNSPYQLDLPEGWLGYVYPPLLAWLMTPLTLLSVPVAVSVWAALSVLFVVAALWNLGVRDWRCYPVALLWPFNRDAIEFGAIEGLLVLAVSLSWRYRDTPVRASLAGGLSIALKLYVWPLALWHGLSGRTRTAFLTCVATVGFVLVPWALIGFQGLSSYPSLLSHAADQQTTPGASRARRGARFRDDLRPNPVASSRSVPPLPVFPGRSRTRRHSGSAGSTLVHLGDCRSTRTHAGGVEPLPVALDRPRRARAAATVRPLGPSARCQLPLPVRLVRAWRWTPAHRRDHGGRGGDDRPSGRGASTAPVERAQAHVDQSEALPLLAHVAAGFAVAGVLAVGFVLVPEKLNDRPYNPLGHDTSHRHEH